MLLSMTGFGEARRQNDNWTVAVEIRAVNNRHFKMVSRISDPYGPLENDLEALVRAQVRRGTIQLSLRVERPKRADDYRLNTVALVSYRDQAKQIFGSSIDLSALLTLPGVVEETITNATDVHEDWPRLAEIVSEALEKFQSARAEEGKAMCKELRQLASSIGENLKSVVDRGPEVVSSYRSRLQERVQSVLAEEGVRIEPADLIREVAVFAERADVAEETVRLKAHLDQFRTILDEPESGGRKLEFVVQEMGRETNTIGSKANDVNISREVVSIKGALEKIRELVQNVE